MTNWTFRGNVYGVRTETLQMFPHTATRQNSKTNGWIGWTGYGEEIQGGNKGNNMTRVP